MHSRLRIYGISSRQGSGAVLLDKQVEEHFVPVTGIGSPANQQESEMQARGQYRKTCFPSKTSQLKARKGEQNDARAKQKARKLMEGEREVDRAKQMARKAMKGERERKRTQRRATKVLNEEHENGGTQQRARQAMKGENVVRKAKQRAKRRAKRRAKQRARKAMKAVVPEDSPRANSAVGNGLQHVVHHASITHVLVHLLPGQAA
jgi:hypothetical protein